MQKVTLPNHQDILDSLREHYDIALTTLTHLSIGADSSASVYRGWMKTDQPTSSS